MMKSGGGVFGVQPSPVHCSPLQSTALQSPPSCPSTQAVSTQDSGQGPLEEQPIVAADVTGWEPPTPLSKRPPSLSQSPMIAFPCSLEPGQVRLSHRTFTIPSIYLGWHQAHASRSAYQPKNGKITALPNFFLRVCSVTLYFPYHYAFLSLKHTILSKRLLFQFLHP